MCQRVNTGDSYIFCFAYLLCGGPLIGTPHIDVHRELSRGPGRPVQYVIHTMVVCWSKVAVYMTVPKGGRTSNVGNNDLM